MGFRLSTRTRAYIMPMSMGKASAPFIPVMKWQKIRPRERVYPYDIIVHNGGLEQY